MSDRLFFSLLFACIPLVNIRWYTRVLLSVQNFYLSLSVFFFVFLEENKLIQYS